MNLKVCLNSSPGKEGLSLVSGWLMAGRLGSIEIYCTRLDSDCPGGSDRLVIHSVSSDVFRSYIVEQDWTQVSKKEGTFVLESTVDSSNHSADRTGISPACIRTSTPSRPNSNRSSHGSRIPSANNRRSVNLDCASSLMNGSMTSSIHRPDLAAVISQVED